MPAGTVSTVYHLAEQALLFVLLLTFIYGYFQNTVVYVSRNLLRYVFSGVVSP